MKLTKEREAFSVEDTLKLALKLLEEIHVGNMTPMAEINWNKAITAIKEALNTSLAQPVVSVEQKPVAIYQLQKSDGSWIDQDQGSYRYNSQHGHTVRIVYTSPPQGFKENE